MNRILFITALIAVFVSNVFALEMKIHTLYLTARVDGKTATGTVGADQNSIVPLIMDGYGLNYETVILPTDSLKLEEGNVALYNTIVVEGATQQQLNQVKKQIEDYQTKYKIRVVYLNCEPDVMLGFKPANSFMGFTNANPRQVKLTKEGIELAHQYDMKGDDITFNVETCVLRDPTKAGDCISYHHYEVAFEEGSNVKFTPLLSYVEQQTQAPLQRRAKAKAQNQPQAQPQDQQTQQTQPQDQQTQQPQPQNQQTQQPQPQNQQTQQPQPQDQQTQPTQPTTPQVQQGYAGAIVERNGLEEMHFWVSNIDSNIAYFIAHLWISWSNYGLIDGYRRLLLEIQIDDYFTDNCFQKGDCLGKHEAPGVPHYRTSVQDMKNIAQWHHDVSGRLPEGSDIKIELAINGFHILSQADHKNYQKWQWDVPETNYTYVKKPGDPETHRWPEQFDDDWDDNVLQENDPLYKHFKDPKNQDDFYWLTHTFTHLKLDAASYRDSDLEMKENIKMTKDPYLGMYDRPCYSKHSIVCPEISGLHNGDNLKAFNDNEVYYAVGDTSRGDLSPANFYFPYITNQTQSGFDGFVVFPRQPTQVYWDCSTIEENMAYYKTFFVGTVRANDDWTENLNKEAELYIRNFLKLRHDPYMFHEGNLRNEDFEQVTIGTATGKFGMMQQWVERLVVELNKYFNWPVRSIKMDDLAAVYIDRISKDSCKPQYTMVIDDKTGIIQEVKVQSSEDVKLDVAGKYEAKCRAPLFVMRDVEFQKDNIDKSEKFGDEPPTAWVVLDKPGESKSFKFTKEIKYNDEKFIGKDLSGSNLLLYILIGVGAVVLIIIAFLIIRKCTKKEPNRKNYQKYNY